VRHAWRLATLGAALTLVLGAVSAQAKEGHWSTVAAEVVAGIDKGEKLAKDGHSDKAKDAVVNAYFDVFEELKMEKAVRLHISLTRTTEIEQLFEDLEEAAGTPGSAKVHPLAEELRRILRHDAGQLDRDKIAADGVSKE